MRVTREQAKANEARVVDTAAKLFRAQGFNGIGVAGLMKAAGLTQGGFYRNFASKDDLAVRACQRASETSQVELSERIAAATGKQFVELVEHYVSMKHRDTPARAAY